MKCCEVSEDREITATKKGFLENGALEDGKIRLERDIEKGISGEESSVNRGHEVKLGTVFWASEELGQVRQKVCAGRNRGRSVGAGGDI